MAGHIAAALDSAERDDGRRQGGHAVPAGRILARTGGASLTTNIALVKHNARLAAQIAVALAASQP